MSDAKTSGLSVLHVPDRAAVDSSATNEARQVGMSSMRPSTPLHGLATERVMPDLQRTLAAETNEHQQLTHLRPGNEALIRILLPTKAKEGFRHAVFGSPGKGKTHHARLLLNHCLHSRIVDCALTHDTKGREAEFQGEERANMQAVREKPPQGNHVIFRGDAFRGIECSPEETASLGLHIARTSSAKVLVTLNELDQALTPGGRGWAAPSVRVCSSQGRALGLSLLVTTQQPHRTPNEILDQATSIAFFRLEARSLNYLSGVLLLPPDFVEAVGKLQPREFVLWVPGEEFEGEHYAH